MARVRVAVMLVALAGAAGADEAKKPGGFTLGLVQRSLKPGLAQAEVAERLGAPNIVTRDGQGREAWVYDRTATEVESSGRHVSAGLGGAAARAATLGLLGIGGGAHSSTRTSSTQRTLTVVVRFDADGAVASFSFHESRF
ncbi:MAG: hypothetical protein U0599_05285 [Vicinamibacteria bacterium]